MILIKKIIKRYKSTTPIQWRITGRFFLIVSGHIAGANLHDNFFVSLAIVSCGILGDFLVNLAEEKEKNDKKD